MATCKNCGSKLNGAYCHQCGQKSRTERISLNYLIAEFLHFFTHLEKGFLFTSYQMLRNPGNLVISFLDGKRKSYQTPVSYFIIWTAIFIILLLSMEIVFGKGQVLNYNDYYGPGRSTEYAIRHLTYILIAIFPFLSLYFWIFPAAFKYNYFESMVTVFYVIGTILLLQCIFVLLAIIYHLISGKSMNLLYSDSFKVFFVSWFAWSFLKLFPVNYKIIRGILFVVLCFGSFTIWRIFVYPWLATHFIN